MPGDWIQHELPYMHICTCSQGLSSWLLQLITPARAIYQSRIFSSSRVVMQWASLSCTRDLFSWRLFIGVTKKPSLMSKVKHLQCSKELLICYTWFRKKKSLQSQTETQNTVNPLRLPPAVINEESFRNIWLKKQNQSRSTSLNS